MQGGDKENYRVVAGTQLKKQVGRRKFKGVIVGRE